MTRIIFQRLSHAGRVPITLVLLAVSLGFAARLPGADTASTLKLSRADYLDRVQAIWLAQMLAAKITFPHEHQVASTRWLDKFPRSYDHAIVDDDWYYEMVAIRAFEKYGVGMTVEQLGEQWKENACGSWGSSKEARLNLLKGLKPPATGHPRYNKMWFSIGPQFSADVYGALAPGRVNLAGRLAREFGHINGYAEGTDGAVFTAAMVSLGFTETDPRVIVHKAAQLLHPSSPYRQCLDLVISLADQGKSFEEIAAAVEDRWHIEYPATNNAVPNGGLVAASVWFGDADFLKTMNLAARAGDFVDADCNAANACAVVGAMRGLKALPANLVAQLHDRIQGAEMGGVKLTPPVDEKISDLAKRTAAVGEKLLLARSADGPPANQVRLDGEALVIPIETPVTQPAELFKLGDLTQYWNPDWTLERAGFGGAGGGMGGIRGITYLDGDVLATYPRDEVRGCLLRRTLKIGEHAKLRFEAGCDAGRAWELNIYAGNQRLAKRLIEGGASGERRWQEIECDLSRFAGQTVTVRLYQRVLLGQRTAGNAYWRISRAYE